MYVWLVLSAFLHDAVLLWALGVNRTLSAGGEADDGEMIAHSVQNQTFENGVTGTMAINENGDRKWDNVVTIVQKDLQVNSSITWYP